MNATKVRFNRIAAQIQNPENNQPISAVLYGSEIETLPNYINRHLSGKFSIRIHKHECVDRDRWKCTITYKNGR